MLKAMLLLRQNVTSGVDYFVGLMAAQSNISSSAMECVKLITMNLLESLEDQSVASKYGRRKVKIKFIH